MRIKLWLIKIVRSAVYVAFIYIVFKILNQLLLLDYINIDFIPILTQRNFLLILGLTEFIFFCIKNLPIAFITFIKKNAVLIEIVLFIGGIIVFKKYYLNLWPSIIAFFELFMLFVLKRRFFSYIHDYDIKEDGQMISNFTETPVAGKEKLTEPQRKVLGKLLKIISDRTKDESINIALVGEWGRGKTSITDTLIAILQKSKKYFVLKINTQTFNATCNIVEYVEKFFHCLFEKYEIRFFDRESVTFLSSLGEMLQGVKKENNWIEKIVEGTTGYFIDIEDERELFSQNVNKLLKVSKKNIVIIIDDADRSTIKQEVLRLLSEFSSIKGILSVISLNKSDEIKLQPSLINEQGSISRGIDENKIFDELDKYIHITVKMEDSHFIENELEITQQIIYEFNNLDRKENRYIHYEQKQEKIHILGQIADYQTNIEQKPNHILSTDSNILTDIFFENLKYNKKSFGNYFQSIIWEYIYFSEELFPYIIKILQEGNDSQDLDLWRIRANWTNMVEDEMFDWLLRLRMNAEKSFNLLCGLLDGLILLQESQESINDICDINDVYEYYHFKKHPFIPEYTWETRKKYNLDFGIVESIILMFSETEKRHINELIEKNEYKEAYGTIKEKLSGMAGFYVQVLELCDFVQYLRKMINNYRSFKMQLREAELENMNYLDYLLSQWSPSEFVRNSTDNLKRQYNCLTDFEFSWPMLKSFISTVLFKYYFGDISERCPEIKEWNDCRIRLFNNRIKPMIIISGTIDGEKQYILIDLLNQTKSQVSDWENEKIQELI